VLLLFTVFFDDEQGKFEYLYNRYKNLLFHKARQILGDHMLAEDAVSEAYIRVLRNLHKIDEVDSPRCVAFLVTITRNTALSLLKRTKNERAEEIDETLPDSTDIEERVLSDLSHSRIVELMDQLDESLRHIFLLKYAYDLPSKEIARQMDTTENNINVKLYRAKQKLAKIFREEGYGNGE